jgi:hypothetical protein
MLPDLLKYEREAALGKRNKKSVFSAVFIFVSLLIVTSFALGIAYFSLAKEIPPFFQSVLSKSWSKTGGKVVNTFTSTKSVPGGVRSIRGGIRYVPNVVYSYRVADTEYRGDIINFSSDISFSSQEESDNYLDSYRNKSVEVFYNSNNPQESTLSREYVYKLDDYQAGCCCGSFGIVFAIMLWFSAKDLIKLFRKQKSGEKK